MKTWTKDERPLAGFGHRIVVYKQTEEGKKTPSKTVAFCTNCYRNATTALDMQEHAECSKSHEPVGAREERRQALIKVIGLVEDLDLIEVAVRSSVPAAIGTPAAI